MAAVRPARLQAPPARRDARLAMERLRLAPVPGCRGAREIRWGPFRLLWLEVECRRARPIGDLVESFGGTARHLAWARRHGVPEHTDYAWVHDLKVPARWRGLGLARHALDCLQRDTGAVILVRLGPASQARLSPRARRQVYRRLGFALCRVGGQEFGLRAAPPATQPERPRPPAERERPAPRRARIGPKR